MKTAVHVGAGNIGRGVVAQFVQEDEVVAAIASAEIVMPGGTDILAAEVRKHSLRLDR
ncbi:hypothetical protein BH10ACT6_BH10ACT6_12210 [soil metagenome]